MILWEHWTQTALICMNKRHPLFGILICATLPFVPVFPGPFSTHKVLVSSLCANATRLRHELGADASLTLNILEDRGWFNQENLTCKMKENSEPGCYTQNNWKTPVVGGNCVRQGGGDRGLQHGSIPQQLPDSNLPDSTCSGGSIILLVHKYGKNNY